MRKIKVLHVISQLAAGGIEKWLIDFQAVSKNIDHDYFAVSGKKGVWDKQVRGNIYYFPNLLGGKFMFLIRLMFFAHSIKDNYDVIHIHLYRFSGFISFIFWINGFRNIIVHAHNDKRNQRAAQSFLKRTASVLYEVIAKMLIFLSSNRCVAAGQGAADDLFGKVNEYKTNVIFCGIDLKNSIDPLLQASYKKEFNISTDELVLIHVGSFTEQKNHKFMIDLGCELQRKGGSFKLILIGDGKLKSSIEDIVARNGITEKVIFAGNRNDVQPILQNIPSVFLFPSLYEGLGLALIEAQYSGRPCLVSNAIPNEAVVQSKLVFRLPMDAGSWTDQLLDIKTNGGHLAIDTYDVSEFSIETSANCFDNLYRNMLSRNDRI